MDTDLPQRRVPFDFTRHVCLPCTATVCAGKCHFCACARCGVSHEERPLYGDGEEGYSFCERCEDEMEAQQRVLDERRRRADEAKRKESLARALARSRALSAAVKQRQNEREREREQTERRAERLEADMRATMASLRLSRAPDKPDE